MVPKWLTSYLANYVINQWSTAFGPISNPSVVEVLYLVKYFGGFKYFTSHDIKNWFKNAVTLDHIDERLTSDSINQAKFKPSILSITCPHKKTLSKYYDLMDSSAVYHIAMGMCLKSIN